MDKILNGTGKGILLASGNRLNLEDCVGVKFNIIDDICSSCEIMEYCRKEFITKMKDSHVNA